MQTSTAPDNPVRTRRTAELSLKMLATFPRRELFLLAQLPLRLFFFSSPSSRPVSPRGHSGSMAPMVGAEGADVGLVFSPPGRGRWARLRLFVTKIQSSKVGV